jgi:cytochrome P450
MVEEAKGRRNKDHVPDTLLEAFLDKIEKHRGDKDTPFIEENLIVLLQDIFVAGIETTSTLVSWVILYLTMQKPVRRFYTSWGTPVV